MSGTCAPLYLLAGGHGTRREGGDPLMQRVLASAGVAHPKVAYVGAASGESKPFLLAMTTHFRLCGAQEVKLAPFLGRHVNMDKTRAILERADIVFVSGGDVEVGMRVVQEREMIPFLRALYEAGKPFFGLSAGTIMLGQEWVRWRDPNDDATAELFPCLGFAPLCCDTHAEADGFEELQALVGLQPQGAVGYGIPSGAGVCVHPDGQLEALVAPVYRYRHEASGVARIADLALP
jgi:peptidase E